MPYSAEVFKVLIASPSDVEKERQIIRSTIIEWNYLHSEERRQVLMPVGWETHSAPLMGDRPQSIINKQVADGCDLLVASFWTRLGTDTGKAASGTVEEINEHLAAGKPAMLYFSSAPVEYSSVDRGQYDALTKFREECRPTGLVEPYHSLTEFKEKFARQLVSTVRDKFPSTSGHLAAFVAPRSTPSLPDLSDIAKAILVAAATDRNGMIMRLRHSGGLDIQVDQQQFVRSGDPRSEADGEAALRELEERLLIESPGYEREIFNITREGYRVADTLPAEA